VFSLPGAVTVIRSTQQPNTPLRRGGLQARGCLGALNYSATTAQRGKAAGGTTYVQAWAFTVPPAELALLTPGSTRQSISHAQAQRLRLLL
jgi:hypothetical protein